MGHQLLAFHVDMHVKLMTTMVQPHESICECNVAIFQVHMKDWILNHLIHFAPLEIQQKKSHKRIKKI